MLAYAARPRRGGKLCGAGVVEQQERAQVLPESVVRKEAAHRKAVADPMPLRAGMYSEQRLFHDELLQIA
jgi:hypothetical protein